MHRVCMKPGGCSHVAVTDVAIEPLGATAQLVKLGTLYTAEPAASSPNVGNHEPSCQLCTP